MFAQSITPSDAFSSVDVSSISFSETADFHSTHLVWIETIVRFHFGSLVSGIIYRSESSW